VKIIGLTGNIASGKSAVLDLFRKQGCHTISTDKITHELLKTNEKIKEEIKSNFGNEVTKKDGSIDRTRLAGIVFNNNLLLKDLELILHPTIEQVVNDKIAKLSPNSKVVIEIPLLFEAGWDTKMDHVVLITCPKKNRKERYLQTKGRTAEDFDRREALQWDEEKKAKLASHIIDNSAKLQNTEELVKRFLDSL
jgi:dephospho-CoA kinase